MIFFSKAKYLNTVAKLPQFFTSHFFYNRKKVFSSFYHVLEFCLMPKISETNLYVPVALKAFYVKENGLHKFVFLQKQTELCSC